MYGQIHDQDSEPIWAFTLAQSIAKDYETREQIRCPFCIDSTAALPIKRARIMVQKLP